jgi:Flp pilus assembly protein TadG
MPRCSPDFRRRLHARLREALCLQPDAATVGMQGIRAVRSGDRQPYPQTQTARDQNGVHEQGSAVVEFTFLALLLMVPLVYFIITMGQIQGGSFAVVGAADQAAKVYVAQPDSSSAEAAAEQAVAIALADFGHRPEEASVAISCHPVDCQAAGTVVTASVRLAVPLPFIPFGDSLRLSATEVEASATQVVGKFR